MSLLKMVKILVLVPINLPLYKLIVPKLVLLSFYGLSWADITEEKQEKE